MRTLLATLVLLAAARAPAAEPFTFNPGDHVCIIGNGTADRMQHDGWLETFIHASLPKHNLVFRNLGFAGDELTVRLRSQDFGSPDYWLTKCQADVIFAFFGFNESFAGEAGLPKFKKDLDDFITHTLAQKYNGKSPPRLVLFSPIAHEDLKNPHLPDGKENNKRLAMYTDAMAEVAKARGVRFVDLFQLSKAKVYLSAKPATINGIHLNEDGDRVLSASIARELLGKKFVSHVDGFLTQAVAKKDDVWFRRYRTTDGYSIYGGRADLKFVDGQTNRFVAQREMEVLDVMTANRDKVIWGFADGSLQEKYSISLNPSWVWDDSNTPPFIPVITNFPGKGPNGTHLFLDGDEAIKSMTVAKGLKVNLFASEKQFPDLVNPVQMTWDAKGRLWVAVWPTYPHWKPKEPRNDKLLILEDTNGDGRADKCTVFADGLSNPTGFEFVPGGVLIAQAPDVMLLKPDKTGDKCESRERVLMGIDSADTHHTANSFAVDPGGAVYFQEGTFHHTSVETPWGPPVRNVNAGVYRFEPRTFKFETYIPFGFANPHGHVFDRWGRDIVVDGTGSQPYDAALFSGHMEYPMKHATPPQVYQQWTRPCAGIEILSSRHFPEEWQGNLLVSNVIGYQGILQYKLRDEGASFVGTEAERLLSSSDPNFRPSDIKIGPDGGIYFADWHNPIIGHMQHNLRDPSRDTTHGRIYRVTYEGRPLLKDPPIAGQPVGNLLRLLEWPEDRVRARVRQELANRTMEQLNSATRPTKPELQIPNPDEDLGALEVLWLNQARDHVAPELLYELLRAPNYRVRAAATRVLCCWRIRLEDAVERLEKLAADDHPRVRLEAIRAASFFTEPEAFEICLIAAEKPTDKYLDFVQGETRKTLEPIVRKALAAGKPNWFTTDAGHRWYVKNVETVALAKLPRNRMIALELLTRPGVSDELRKAAAADLAKFDSISEPKALLAALQVLGEEARTDHSTVYDLVRLLTAREPGELSAIRADLEALATKARSPIARQFGFVALIAADKGIDRAWALAQTSLTPLRDLLEAVPLIRDFQVRASLFPKIEPLLTTLPPSIAGMKTKDVRGRYVRIELPGDKRTLTLAEVEVWGGARNLARGATATQKNTASGGEASRAIDGNTSGAYNDHGQTHTRENTANPWWEVDLGQEWPISRVAIWNRTDGDLGKRLDGFTLQVLDNSRRVVFEKTKLPAPKASATIEVGGEAPELLIRYAAMNALTAMPGQEAAAFRAISKFLAGVSDPGYRSNRVAAVQALKRIPSNAWPTGETKPVLDALISWVRETPVPERTTPEMLDALQLADALSLTLPNDQARVARRALGELSVRVLRVGTKFEQMLFDQDRLVVQAGKRVEIVFENTDLMPHNFVIVAPGSLEEIGNMAEAAVTDPQAAAREYVPQSQKVLLASKLTQPRTSQKLGFEAPKEPGIYPYVCTHPGHWRRMYGALYVVADLEEYLADAEGYLAKHPLVAVDPLLKSNRPRKEWKLEELADALPHLGQGRSFAAGQQIFQTASCMSCHKMSGAGHEIGPDLTKLDAKLTAKEILFDILEPSAKIDEKYQSWRVETTAGKVVTGLIVGETPEVVKLIENPLASTTPIEIKKGQIAGRERVATSIMPKGLLDKLTREEILDLLAFVVARGDAKSAVYSGGHSHGH
jgi:putative heme-binding domain-containing protein